MKTSKYFLFTVIISNLLCTGCIFNTGNIFCTITNSMDTSVTIQGLSGYVTYSTETAIQPNQTKKFISETSSIGEGLNITVRINETIYTASSNYIQDYSTVSLIFTNTDDKQQVTFYTPKGSIIRTTELNAQNK